MANQRRESVSLPGQPGRVAPVSTIAGVPQLSARGLAQASSQGSGAVELFTKAAGMFGRMAGEIGEIADRAAQREGLEDGALAGRDQEFRLRGDETLYSQAFNAAGLDTFKSKMSVDLVDQMTKVYDKHTADPQGLEAALGNVWSGWSKGLNQSLAPHVLPQAEALFNRQKVGLVRDATRAFHDNVRAEQMGALEAEREMRARTAEQQAFRLGLDATANEALAGELAEMKQRLAVRGPDGKYLVSPESQARLLRDTELGMARARISGAFARLPDMASRERFLADLEARYQAGGDQVLDLLDPDQFHALAATLSSEVRREGLGARQAERALTHDLKSFADAAKDGVALRDDEMAGLKARVAASDNPEVIEAWNDGLETLSLVRHLNTQPLPVIEAAVAAEEQRVRDEGASLEGRDLVRLDLMRGYVDKARTSLASDPLGFAAKTGAVELAPLDPSNPASLRGRVAAAEHVAEVYGREPVYFRPEERVQLAAVSRQGGDQMLAIAGTIAGTFGEAAPAALAEISKDAPALALVGGLWQTTGEREPPAIARDVAKGFELRGMKGFKTLVDQKQTPATVAGVLGSALRERPEDRQAVIDAANAAYDAHAYRHGLEVFEPEVYGAKLREVLGERTIAGKVYGGVVNQSWYFASDGPSIVLPPAMRQDSWRETLEMVDLGDLDRAGIPRPPIALARVRAGNLVPAGDGVFAVSLGKWDQKGAEEFVAGPDGAPWLIDLKALSPVLAKRRPDLFVGG